MMNKRALILGMAPILTTSATQANWFDQLSTAVGGHITDIQSRFMEDQVIEGDVIAKAILRENDRGQDTLHHGSGTVQIVNTPDGRYLQFAEDFSSTPGPDYHVYVSQDTKVDHEDRFNKARQIELGKLIKGSGASYYKIPEGIEFQSVTIWCKAFNEFIVSADFPTQ